MRIGGSLLGSKRLIGQTLIDEGHVTAAEIEEALRVQRETGQKLGYILVDRFGVDPDAVADARIDQEWAEGKAADELPPSVETYIRERGLYKNGPDAGPSR